MLRFVLGRLVGGLFVVFAVATIAFFLMKAAPGNPFDQEKTLLPEAQRNMELRYKVNEPVWKQYVNHIDGLVHLDLGYSWKRNQSVNELIAEHFGYSLTLGLMAISIAVFLGGTMGILAAWRRNRWPDHVLMTTALLGISVPSIVLAPLCIQIFSLSLGWFPSGRADSLWSYVLPSTVLGLIYTGTVARLSRAGMLETLGQDFIRTARAKGLSEHKVIWKHALRLGVMPVVSYLGPATAALLSGSFVVEKYFQIPGLGFYFVAAVADRDSPLLCGMLIFYVAFLVVLNLAVDIAYGLLDPRIRERK